MNEENTSSIASKVKELLKGIPDSSDINCCAHPSETAFIPCSSCGKGICPECIRNSPESWHLLCKECRRKKIRFDPMKLLRALKYPASWVMLCLLIAVVFYSTGFGNPDINRYIREDAGKPWFKQRAGKLYISQAAREKNRACFLLAAKRYKEADKWFRMSCKAFNLALGVWKDAPVADQIRIASAFTLAESGRCDEALRDLESLKINQESSLYSAWQYYIGLTYEQMKNKDKAEEHFKNAEKYFKKKVFSIDAMIDDANTPKDFQKSQMENFVSAVCETDIPYQAIKGKCGDKDTEPSETDADTEEPAVEEIKNDSKEKPTDFEIEILEDK